MQAEHHIFNYNVSPTATRLAATAGVAAMSAGSGLVAYFDPSKISFLPLCPLYHLTGFAVRAAGLRADFMLYFTAMF